MDNEAQLLLEDIISFCQRDAREPRLINMLEQCTATLYTEDALHIAAPSRFAYAYLLKQQALIEQYLEEITFMETKLVASILDHETSAPAAGAAARVQPDEQAPSIADIQTASVNSQPVATANPASFHTEAAASRGAESGDANAATDFHQQVTGAEPQMPAMAEGPAARNLQMPVAPADPTPAYPPTRPTDHPAGEAGGINVVKTVSADMFQKMMQDMRGNEVKPVKKQAPVPAGAATTGDNAEDAYPSVDVNAKYTFESFVFGDENKHAYQSSVRFAAFADEPGQCTSLFIYGNSGLGKTHLLFAIKNYLAAEKPHIKVKYANSQAYFEDYLHDLSLQKGPGEPIMREYHAADILIIDDIQGIVGKQATIEYFFQLVDEFIRRGKKIVIASDRAPKDLNLDERLTSRFSHGMLCLVSEPGFEMKYTILKRYYETIICRPADMAGINLDASLLSTLQTYEGHLTDEQLRHMAEISGNNIRNLESFCERCASRSAEREVEGRELSAEDIDDIAEQYFNTAHKIIHVGTVQKVVEEYYRVSHEDIIGPRRTANIAWARHVAVYLANSLCEMTTPAIGAEFGGRDHSTVLNSLKVVENKMKGNRQIFEDLQTLKNKIILKS